MEKQIKLSLEVESIPSEMPSEPAQEMHEPLQEISTEVDEDVRITRAQELLQESDHTRVKSEVEAPQETKKKKRGLF